MNAGLSQNAALPIVPASTPAEAQRLADGLMRMMAGLLDIVHAKTRTLYPQVRKPGSDKFERISWDQALDRIARLMKDDRDKNFVAKNADGVTVNRWLTTGFLAASATKLLLAR